MKPWFLIRTPSGRRWHVVNEFHHNPTSGRHLVSTICRSEAVYPLIPVSRHIDYHDLAAGDLVSATLDAVGQRMAAVIEAGGAS